MNDNSLPNWAKTGQILIPLEEELHFQRVKLIFIPDYFKVLSINIDFITLLSYDQNAKVMGERNLFFRYKDLGISWSDESFRCASEEEVKKFEWLLEKSSK